MDQRPLEVEALLAQSGWLRALAIRLVYDENRADDLVQEVWLQALERPPRREGSIRGWLSTVLLSRWRDLQRSEAARGARERAVQGVRTAPPTAEIAARVEAQQTVARAVLDLDEPLREVVLLHFFEELPLREVGRRLDLPYETVRHRLGRALDALRFRLRQVRGDDESRRLALVLVAGGTGGPPAASAGGGARHASRARWIAAGVAVSLLGSAAFVIASSSWRDTTDSRARPTPETASAPPMTHTSDSAAAAESASTASDSTPAGRTPRARAEVRVRTVAGEAVTGATVEAWTFPARLDGVSTRVAATATDREGRARIDALAPGRFTFVALAAGHALASAEDRSLDSGGSPHRVELVLGDGHALRGRVTDQDGRAVAGAVLVAEPPRQTWDQTRTSLRRQTAADSEGRYAFDVLPSGETTLWAALPGGVPTPAATVLVPSVTTFDVQLRRGGTVRGRVTDEATGAPVAGADVRVQGWAAADVLFGRTLTGSDGGYVVEALVECTVRQVVAEKDGYAIDALADPRVSPMATFTVPRGATVTRDLVLRRGGRVSGRVSAAGVPLAGAAVSAMFANRLGQWTVRDATTGDDGRYAVEHVGAGQAFVRVESPGLKEAVLSDPAVANSISLEPFRANVTDGGDAVFDVEMIADDAQPAPPAGRVRGVVVDEGGTALRGAWVEVLPTTGGVAVGFARERAFIGPDGAFDLTAPPRTSAMRIRAAGPDVADTWSAEIALTSLPEAAPATLRLERGAPLSGEVRREGSGSPVPGAAVRISTAREDGRFAKRPLGWIVPIVAITRVDGRFVVPHLRAGTYEVVTEAEGWVAALRTIEVPSADPVVFDLEPALAIDGRVAFADGTGLPGVRVVAAPEARSKTPNPVARPADATTAQDGSFVLRGVAPGRYRLRVSAPSDPSLNFVQPPPEPIEAGTHDADVLVERALEIAGRVLDAAGRPLEHVLVSLDGPGSRVEPQGTSADGAFRFVALRPGIHTVSARTALPGADVSIARREGVAAGTSGLELVLVAALSIEGVVLDPEGREMAGVAVQATPLDRPPTEESRGFQPVGAGGRFALHGLGPGTYEIGVGNLRDRLRPLVVRGKRRFAAGATDLRLEVRAALTVSGRLLDAKGQPFAGRVIEFVPNDAVWPKRRVTTSATGEFTCDGLGPGRHRAELVEGDADERVPCGECDAGATGMEWSVR